MNYDMLEDFFANGGEMIRRADGSTSRRGLWDNIRANKGSGKKPTKEMLEQERKINAANKYPGGGDVPVNVERMDSASVTKKDSLMNKYKRFINRKDNSSLENLIEFVDPTGVSSHDDAYQAYNQWQQSNSMLPSLGQALDMFGAVPMLGKLGKIKYLNPDALKTAYKTIPWQKIINTFDTVEDETANRNINNEIVQAKKKHGGAVDLNAFYDQPRYIQTNIFAEGGSFGTAPVNTFMSPGTDSDPRFEQYYNQQIQKFTQSGVKEIPSRNDIYSYYQSSNPVGVTDQTGRMVFSNPQGNISAGATFTQAVDPMTGKPLNQGTNLAKSAFDRQAQRFDFGGVLPEMAYGEEIPMVFSPEAQKQFAKSNASWGFHGDVNKGAGKVTPPLPTGTPMFYADAYMPGPGLTSGSAPVSGQPFVRNTSQPTIKADVNSGSVTDLLQNPPVKGQTFERNTSPNFNADVYQGDPGLTSGAMMGMGPEIQLPANEKMQYAWTAGTEFEKIPKAPVAAPKTAVGPAKGFTNNTNGLWNNKTYDALSMMAMLPLGNRGLAGVMKAGIGTAGFVGGLGTGVDNIYRGFQPRQQEGGQIPQYDFAGPVDQQRRWGLDPDGVSRAIGAAAGLGMVNDVVGYNQAFNNLERNQVRAGMSDMRGVSNPYMQQGYDVLNTGPGQTQAPNLYTPMQFSGNRSAGFFEEGGEYEMTEEQLRQFLANGGEVEYL